MKKNAKDTLALKILYLEDSLRDIGIIREQLKDAGYDLRMDCTATREDFEALLRENKFDIILSNFALPEFNAFDVLRLANEISPEVPFICISNSVGEETAIELIKQGAADYILRDRIARLPSSIERALGEVREKEAQRSAEEALNESEQRFHRLFAASPDALMLIDPYDTTADWPIVDCNEVACQMNGYKRGELIGQSINILNTSEGTPQDRTAYIESIRSEGVLHLESSHRHRDGHIFPIEISTSMITFKGRELLLGIDRDITERKRAEETVRLSEERYRALFTLSPHAIYVHVNARIVLVNPAICELLGADDPSQLIGKSVFEIVHPEYHEVMRRRWDLVFNDQAAPLLEEKFVRLDRAVVDVEVSAAAIDWQGAKGVQVIARDITERKRAEEKVRESEERFRLVFENVLDGISIYDQDPDPAKRKLIECNERYADMAGRSREELLRLGTTYGLMIPLEEGMNEHRLESLAKGTAFQGSFSWIRPDGKENIIEYVGVPVSWRGKALTIGIDRDITERKHSEEALRQAQKLESIGTLAGGIAHDFNNLLNAILGQSTLAINKLSNENPARDHIEKSLKAAERAADLTRHLLAYSGQGKFVTQVIDLNRLVEENIQILEVSVPKTVQLMFELASPSPHLHGDVSQIQQVVMNLIINAGEAIAPNPGYITVRSRWIELTENDSEYWKFTNTPLRAGKYAQLQVKDTGKGISPGVLSRIFDPFFSTKFTGRGLGLAAVLGIVRGHHGGLRIQSEEGKGSEFEVVFPLVEAPMLVREPETKTKIFIDGKGKTVLVIDDEPSVVELLNDVFTDANFKVIDALNPIEGIDLYRRHRENIAAVILDYSMPGMDGKAAFEELVKIDKNVKVILCSGYSEEEMKSGFGDLRPQGFIKKPYKPFEIVTMVSGMTLR